MNNPVNAGPCGDVDFVCIPIPPILNHLEGAYPPIGQGSLSSFWDCQIPPVHQNPISDLVPPSTLMHSLLIYVLEECRLPVIYSFEGGMEGDP